jgi:hypothetical protein
MPQFPDYATPPQILDAVRVLMGKIDLDPATSPEFNAFGPRAILYYTKEQNGLDQPWGGRVWLNPPGGKHRPGPKAWWKRLVEEHRAGNVEQACYMSFALDSLQWSQGKGLVPITDYPTVIFASRVKYYRHEVVHKLEENGKEIQYADPDSPIVQLKAPNKASALTWLPPKELSTEAVTNAFVMLCSVFDTSGFKCTPVRRLG